MIYGHKWNRPLKLTFNNYLFSAKEKKYSPLNSFSAVTVSRLAAVVLGHFTLDQVEVVQSLCNIYDLFVRALLLCFGHNSTNMWVPPTWYYWQRECELIGPFISSHTEQLGRFSSTTNHKSALCNGQSQDASAWQLIPHCLPKFQSVKTT